MKADTNPQKIYDFLKWNKRLDFCDDCIEGQTGVNRHQVHTIASTLGLFPKEFNRREGRCSKCISDREKVVIRSN